MRAAGIQRIGGPVEMLDLAEPRPLQPDEVLIDVRAAGVGNWDDITRSGGWDVGAVPPMALGVEACGTVAAVGIDVDPSLVGRVVTTHPVPLRAQGSWAERLIAPVDDIAPVPAGLVPDIAAVLPVPALTADQALDAVGVTSGEQLLVHGAGGVTGRLLVRLAVLRGAFVIATAGPSSAADITALGAGALVDYRNADWVEEVRRLATEAGVDAAVNATVGGASRAISAVRDGGRLATITSDPPPPTRGIQVSTVYVANDGARLQRLVDLAAGGAIAVTIAAAYPLEGAPAALDHARRGASGGGVVLTL